MIEYDARMKRLAILLSISFALAACGKSKPAATTPDNTGGAEATEAMPTDEAAPGGGGADGKDDDAEGGGSKKGMPAPDSDDPCGGGE